MTKVLIGTTNPAKASRIMQTRSIPWAASIAKMIAEAEVFEA